MRLGLAIGLNHSISEAQMSDPVEREHRVRIWWAIYVFDRIWGSKMGLPMSILDEDIYVDLPKAPKPEHAEEFSDTEYLIAQIKLARITGEIIVKLYRRKKSEETFLQRVQKLLKSLNLWLQTLPEHIRLKPGDGESNSRHVVALHISFNQVNIHQLTSSEKLTW